MTGRSSTSSFARDEEFAEAWKQAVEAGIDVIEDEVTRYATEGWDEETYDESGNLVRRVRRRDARLLAHVREWRRPPETSVDVTVGVQMCRWPSRAAR
jgi:hypothetical protein